MTTVEPASNQLAVLARQEILNYLRSWLFWIGAVACMAVVTLGFVDSDGASSVMTMIVPAATVGLLGVIVAARMTRRSDLAAEAAGAVAVSESQRTLALVAATVVPTTVALVAWCVMVVQFFAEPPAAWAVPFGPISDLHVLAVMFALSVVPGIGGPLLGILIARWLRFRGATALSVVALVLVTIMLQGNFEGTWSWQMIWPWTYWYGPLGWSNTVEGTAHWVAISGSPLAWFVYLAALCGLGVVAALLHDPEADRSRLVRVAWGLAAVAVIALAATMTLGLDGPVVNPVPGPSF